MSGRPPISIMPAVVAILVLWIGSLAGRAVPTPNEEPFRVQRAGMDSRYRAQFEVQTNPDYYYQLLRSRDPQNLGMTVDMRLGTGSFLPMLDSVPSLEKAFFRVRRVPLANPMDSDGDGINDVVELLNLPGMNPFNPSRSIAFADGAIQVPSQSSFHALSHFDNFPGAPQVREVKFLITGVDATKPQLYFLNNNKHLYHYYFAREVLNYRPDLSFNAGLSQFNGETYWSNTTRKNLAGSLVVHESYLDARGGAPGIITMEFWPSDTVSYPFVQLAYDLITRSMPWIQTRLAYHAASETQRVLYRQEKAKFQEAQKNKLHVIRSEELFGQTSYTMLNPGVGFGRLMVFDGSTSLSARDVVIFHTIPNDITHVAGIISEVPQTPLSHINLKAKQNDTPNAYIRDATALPQITELIGEYVRYETTSAGYTMRLATQAEVDAFLEALRPPDPQFPIRDLTQQVIRPLSALGFASARAFGAKTANVAELRKITFSTNVYVPDGYGIPFFFYDEFMKYNRLYESAAAILADPEVKSDPAARENALGHLRDQIRAHPLPDWMMTALTTLQNNYPDGTPIRCRSSTNNEDLTGYSGAGLYDSYTHRPDEGHLSKSIKQVWASTWTLRAYDERDFYRVDHLTTAMGVLVHKNFDDEKSNGVAVTKNLVDPAWTGYYVNCQVGENLVTNPEANSVPEEFLIARLLGQTRYTIQYVSFSNQLPEGTYVISTAQAELLADQMARIHSRFAPLYKNPVGFAMELEWKFDFAGKLVIKQARPWVE
jgi:hypothetical protein